MALVNLSRHIRKLSSGPARRLMLLQLVPELVVAPFCLRPARESESEAAIAEAGPERTLSYL